MRIKYVTNTIVFVIYFILILTSSPPSRHGVNMSFICRVDGAVVVVVVTVIVASTSRERDETRKHARRDNEQITSNDHGTHSPDKRTIDKLYLTIRRASSLLRARSPAQPRAQSRLNCAEYPEKNFGLSPSIKPGSSFFSPPNESFKPECMQSHG